jgi:hypothetical protein
MFSDTPDPNTRLVVGSVIPSQGTVVTGNTTGDTTVAVNLGSLAPAASANITFQVTINDPLYVTQVANHAIVQGSNFDPVNSDDPGTAAQNDATVINTQPSLRQGVGGEVQPVNRLNLVMPWLAAALVLVVLGAVFRVMRRRSG